MTPNSLYIIILNVYLVFWGPSNLEILCGRTACTGPRTPLHGPAPAELERPRCRQIWSGRAPRGGRSRRGAGAGGRHGEARRAEESGAGAPRAAAGAGGWGAARAAEQEGGAARAAEQEGKVRER